MLRIAAHKAEGAECVTFLLKNGSDPTIVDIWGDTSLHAASTQGGIIQLLLHGRRVQQFPNWQNLFGRFVFSRNVSCIFLFVSHGLSLIYGRRRYYNSDYDKWFLSNVIQPVACAWIFIAKRSSLRSIIGKDMISLIAQEVWNYFTSGDEK